MLNVVCLLRQGGKVGYNAEWVYKLQRAVAQHLSIPHRFVCLSDCEVSCDRIELQYSDSGFWAKLELFRPGLFNGPVLYIDLDTVICSNIDSIVDRCRGNKFVMWVEADKNIHSSALMYWETEVESIWDIYRGQPAKYWQQQYSSPPLYGDQAVVSENMPHCTFLDLCPSNWFHIASRRDTTMDLSQVKMLMFRKTKQKPSTMLDHPLVQQHWK
jgi:alpha-N-acetylglucosamine transferase